MTLPMNTIAATGPPLVPTSKTPWLLLAYLALCFHHCGAVLMLHFFNYPGFRMIDEKREAAFRGAVRLSVLARTENTR